MQLEFSFDDIHAHPLFEGLAEHIVKRFWVYHTENPHVFNLFKRFAGEARHSGRKRYGIAAICERIRWHLEVETRGDEFKINNNYKACYARLIIIHDNSFAGFFQLRSKATGYELD